jgi:hypothetical protein
MIIGRNPYNVRLKKGNSFRMIMINPLHPMKKKKTESNIYSIGLPEGSLELTRGNKNPVNKAKIKNKLSKKSV